MRFLADAGISPRTVEFLQGLGHHAQHVRSLGMQRASDDEIIHRARVDGAVVITFDLDFGDILALGVHDRPSVILLRMSSERPERVNQQLQSVLAERPLELEAGALILIEDARYRLRKLPIGSAR
jgi:predicted nuclease of predicted toxin-antitoxin system